MQTPRGHSGGSPPKSTPQRLGVSSLGFPQGIPRGGGGRRVPKGPPRVPQDVPWGTPWGISGAPQADPWGTPWGMHWVSPCPLYPPKGSTSVWGGIQPKAALGFGQAALDWPGNDKLSPHGPETKAGTQNKQKSVGRETNVRRAASKPSLLPRGNATFSLPLCT